MLTDAARAGVLTLAALTAGTAAYPQNCCGSHWHDGTVDWPCANRSARASRRSHPDRNCYLGERVRLGEAGDETRSHLHQAHQASCQKLAGDMTTCERVTQLIEAFPRVYPGARCELDYKNPLELLI